MRIYFIERACRWRLCLCVCVRARACVCVCTLSDPTRPPHFPLSSTVNDLQVHEVNDIGLIRSNLVGAKGSTVVLRFERHKPKNDEERVITVSLIRS